MAMIRVLNFFCFAVSALACLALYQVSEQTRVARLHLVSVHRQIADERQLAETLQAEWSSVSDPAQIERASQVSMAGDDKPAVVLASTNLLPRRGDNVVADAELRSASAIVATPDSVSQSGIGGN
jgi:hypothetical protein